MEWMRFLSVSEISVPNNVHEWFVYCGSPRVAAAERTTKKKRTTTDKSTTDHSDHFDGIDTVWHVTQ